MSDGSDIHLNWLEEAEEERQLRQQSSEQCAKCGEKLYMHCEMDEPGVDHDSTCPLKHHTFRQQSSEGVVVEIASVRNIDKFRPRFFVEWRGPRPEPGKRYTVIGPIEGEE